MSLYRHNVRGDESGYHWAHDSDVPDTLGCRVAGQTRRVYTNAENPCPQCGGYGQTVRITKLDRNSYPKGAMVPEWARITPKGTPEPEPTPEPTPEPAPAPAPNGNAGQAMSDLFGNMIEQAIAGALEKAKAEQAGLVDLAVKTLEDSFRETVEKLVVPVVVKVDRGDGQPPKEIEGSVHQAFEKCLRWLQARDDNGYPRSLFLTGPAGSGKTTLAKQLAQALDVPFYATGQVISEFQVTGFVGAGGEYHATPVHQAHCQGGLHLGDEFDAWSPEAALALNALLANGYATFPNDPKPIDRHQDTYWLVAGNTWGTGADREYVGRNEMDAATLSRFVTISVDYDKALESQIAGEWQEWRDLVWKVRQNAAELKIRQMFGTRELAHGVAALNHGIRFDEVVSTVLKRNMGQAEWEKVAR